MPTSSKNAPVREVMVKWPKSRGGGRSLRVAKKSKPRKKKEGVVGRAVLIKVADRIWSTYTRNHFRQARKMVHCYTCTYVGTVKTMQNGHYISRYFKNTRWERDNMRPQCFMCNMRLGGCAHIFREKLVIELGESRVVDMEQFAKEPLPQDDDWIVKKINEGLNLCITAGYSLPVVIAKPLLKITPVGASASYYSTKGVKSTVAPISDVVSSMD